MGAEVAAHESTAKAIYERADAVIGRSISHLCFEGPEEELRQTINAQPALFTTSAALLTALRNQVEVKPFAVAGHSVGEYAAIWAAGGIGFEAGLGAVLRRAELMQEAAAARAGTMCAVLGLDIETIHQACSEIFHRNGVVSIANYNCPGQVVISGEVQAVGQAGQMLKERGAKRIVPLAVSGGFHSPLMVGAGDRLYTYLREARFQNARIPVVVNVTAEYIRNGVDFPPHLTMQVSGCVRWEESMRLLIKDGVTVFLEVGAGEVLCGLLRRIEKSEAAAEPVTALAVNDMNSLSEACRILASDEWESLSSGVN
ncbi:MAG: ACP S-malonyltransferase [Armatimonadetes bacterium]|nr:ACP S-malonyltransferase [Armatimonadota bacterium]